MTLLAEVKGFLGLSAQPVLHRDLNLIGAAEAHILWKARLGHHVEGHTRESLENVLVGQGGFCQLGCWIAGPELEPFRELPDFARLSNAHQQFHHLGTLIVERVRAGERAAAREIFRNEYNQSLHAIIQALTTISKHLQAR